MRQAAIAILLSAVSVLWFSTGAVGSEVHWTPAHELAPSGSYGCMAAGDLDGDGDDDIADFVFVNMYRNTGCPGPPAWDLEEDVFPHMNMLGCTGGRGTLGDVDADGDLDLVYGCYECCSLRMVWNVGTPQWPAWEQGGAILGDPYIESYSSPFLADLDGDGDLDVMATDQGGGIFFYENTGTPQAPLWGSRQLIQDIDYGGMDYTVVLGDLDGDGDLDFLGGEGLRRLECWENIGTPQEWSYVPNAAMLTGVDVPTNGVHGVALPDVDCDGDCDLLVSSWGVGYLYLNDQFTPVGMRTWGTIKALFR